MDVEWGMQKRSLSRARGGGAKPVRDIEPAAGRWSSLLTGSMDEPGFAEQQQGGVASASATGPRLAERPTAICEGQRSAGAGRFW